MKKKVIIAIMVLVVIVIALLVENIIKKENRQYEVAKVEDYKYFVVKEEDKYGVINKEGNKIVEIQYEDVKIPNPEKAIFICYENEKTKVLDDNGQELFTNFENIEPIRLKNISSDLMYEKSVLKYSKDGKYGIIDFNGKKITKAIYEEIETLPFKEGELLVKKDGKYGVINIKGAILVKTNYDKIETDKYYEEENGYKKAGYIVSNITDEGYRYGYVNLTSKEIIETKYNDLYRILEIKSDDIYIISAQNGKYGLLKNGKNIIENDYQSIVYSETSNNLIVLKGKKYGVISMTGATIVPTEYKQIDITGEYIYATTNDENTKIFDSNGQETDIDKNLAILNVEDTNYKIYIQTANGKTTYNIYKDQTQITRNEYTYIQYLYDNYFIVCNTNGKLGIIDDTETVKINLEYNSIQKLENSYLIQALDNSTKKTEIYSKEMKKICELANATIVNKSEYIKLYNNEEIKYISKYGKELKNTEIFTNNKIYAKKVGNKWGFVDIDGNKVIDYKYDKVTEINEYGFAGIQQNEKWGVINSNGEIIVNPVYELSTQEPTFIGEYYQVIYGNGERYYTK